MVDSSGLGMNRTVSVSRLHAIELGGAISYAGGMARRADDIPNDPVIVLIDEDEPVGTFDDWLALLSTDPPTDVDADAAEIVRDIREHGEQ